jgi:phospholipid transport system transporter-binding protein
MGKSAEIIYQNNKWMVKGELDFSNVMQLYEKSIRDFQHSSEIIFDFSDITSSNSAGVALLLEWIKFFAKQGIPIKFLHLPQTMLTIAKVAGLEAVIQQNAG